MTKRLLILDMNNCFLRSYIVDPSLGKNGIPIGGLQGTMKSIQKFVRETNPDEIVICWDGGGGSKRKKLLYKEYKEGRKAIRLNRYISNLDEREEKQNKIWQMSRLFEYLELLPINQFVFDDVEADDLISFICQESYYSGWQKVIISSDKDFYQLLFGNDILIYRPIQQEIISKKVVVETFNIHPVNFALVKALVGDESDNIKGIEGAGIKSVSKRFPFLKEDKTYSIDDIVDYSKKQITDGKEIKLYRNVIREHKKIVDNYQLVQLYAPNFSLQNKNLIREGLRNKKYVFKKIEILKKMSQDGFGDWNFEELFSFMNKIFYG